MRFYITVMHILPFSYANYLEIFLFPYKYEAFWNQYMHPHNAKARREYNTFSLLKDFWATVKEILNLSYRIPKSFITEISPLSLANNMS